MTGPGKEVRNTSQEMATDLEMQQLVISTFFGSDPLPVSTLQPDIQLDVR